MNRTQFLIALIGLLLVQSQVVAQTPELPKYEVAAEFTSMDRDNFTGGAEAGLGARFTFNLNKTFSIETAAYHFPRTCFTCEHNGTVTEVFGGLKAGKRFEKFGIFGKARPGIISFSDGLTVEDIDPTFGFPLYHPDRKNYFSIDVGGVLEFYPSARIVTRFDGGDTLIRYRSVELPGPFLLGGPNFQVPGETTHNFQFSAGVGFRF